MALFHRYGENRDFGDIPGERGLPILGMTLRQLRDLTGFRKQMVAKYGNVHWTSTFGRHTLIMLGPDANELVLTDRERIFSSAGGWSPVIGLLFPNGLMLRDFQDHRAHRRIMQSAFKQSALATYVEQLSAGFGAGLEQWPKEGDLRFYNAVKQLTLSSAASVFLGVPLGPEADRLNDAFLATVEASISLIRSPIPGTRMWRGVRGREYIGAYLREQIPLRRAGRETDMFTLLCNAVDEDGHSYSDDDIVDHMIFLLMAAHDTVTSGITTLIYQLCKHPEWQETLREECLALKLDDGQVPVEALARMVKCEWAFKEALRLMPPVPTIPRRSMREFQFKGHSVPANTILAISPQYTHRMSEIWTDPDDFQPDRFSEARAEDKKHKYAWIPFGGGAHLCIGRHFAYMQMKVFLYHLLTRYELRTDPGYEVSYQMPIPKPKDGLPVRIRRLNTQ